MFVLTFLLAVLQSVPTWLLCFLQHVLWLKFLCPIVHLDVCVKSLNTCLPDENVGDQDHLLMDAGSGSWLQIYQYFSLIEYVI